MSRALIQSSSRLLKIQGSWFARFCAYVIQKARQNE